jgi:hypothetical protein
VRDGIGAVFAFFAVIALVGIVIVAGWQAGWWFQTENTNRQAQLDRNGYGFQKPLQDQIGDEIGQVLKLNRSLAGEMNNTTLVGLDSASRKGLVTRICQQATQVNPATPLAADQAAFVAQNCYAGTIAPSSPYN